MNNYVIIIGAGCAGLSCALELAKQGIKSTILEREAEAGGILQQCIHNGFGLHNFKLELSGPSYAQKYIDQINDNPLITLCLNHTVTNISPNKQVTVISPSGLKTLNAKAIVLATGCYERSGGAIKLKGKRPKGIYTAGCAQKYLNMENILVGKRVFILGSGDIGLIMARRMTLEGAKVLGVAEIMPYSNGLERNIKQCLEDFNIPLYLSHTVTSCIGTSKLEKIIIQQVDNNLNPIPNTEKTFDVDTLLLSVGLIPETSLLTPLNISLDNKTKGAIINHQYMTNIDGIFACGNALHVHDLADFASDEGTICAKHIKTYLTSQTPDNAPYHNICKSGISYCLPQKFNNNCDKITFSFRPNCVINNAKIRIYNNNFEKIITKNNLLPSQMERITLTNKELSNINDNLYWEIIK